MQQEQNCQGLTKYCTQLIKTGKFKLEDLGALIEASASSDKLKIAYGMVGLKKLTGHESESIVSINSALIKANLVPLIFELSRNPVQIIQQQALGILINMAVGDTEHCDYLIEKGAVPLLIQHLYSPRKQIVICAIQALNNIGIQTNMHRDLLISKGVIQLISQILQDSADIKIIQAAAFALSGLCRGRPSPPIAKIDAAFIPLCRAISMYEQLDGQILQDCCWALLVFTEHSRYRKQSLPLAQALMRLTYQRQKIVFLKLICNFMLEDDNSVELLINLGVIQLFQFIISKQNRITTRQCCWSLSNLNTCQAHSLRLLSHKTLIKALLELLSSANTQIRNQVLHIFDNIFNSCQYQQFYHLIAETQLVAVLVSQLFSLDQRYLSFVLNTLERLVGKEAACQQINFRPVSQHLQLQGRQAFDHLQIHQNEQIREHSLTIRFSIVNMRIE